MGVEHISNGYVGKFLRVDLTRLKTSSESIKKGLARAYVGGAGIGIKILYDEVAPKVDPFSPENKLIIFTGPFQATLAPSSGRYHVTTKSPLTGLVGDSNSGGHFGAYLKFAGYDGIVIEGSSKKPVYLWIDNGTAEIREATHLWGKNTLETERLIKEELKDGDIKVCSIGPAGENLVRMACMINDLDRAPARTGNGAVMGSKRLKAIAVRGEFSVDVADSDKLDEIVSSVLERMCRDSGAIHFRKYGTVGSFGSSNEVGNLPTKNWLENRFDEGVESLDGMTRSFLNILVKTRSCFGCPIGCGRYTRLSAKYNYVSCGGPEYESQAALGSLCFNKDLESVVYSNVLCNFYGMDTISVGNAVAFAMECYENGLITKQDTGGIELNWGNPEGEVKIIEKIAKREGIGDILAEGVKRAAKAFGKGCEKFAVHVKGLELPMHEPRASPGLDLGYATSTRGACHLRSLVSFVPIWGQTFSLPLAPEALALDRFATQGKAALLILFQNFISLMNSLVYCVISVQSISHQDWIGMLNAITGWSFNYEDVMTIGERIWNLQKLFNLREGASRKDDSLPDRILKHPLPYDPGKGLVANIDTMLDEFYELRGWDNDGKPTEEKLRALGLREIQ